MPRGKREHLSAYVSFDAELAKQVEVHSSCPPISTAEPKSLLDQHDQPLQSRRGRIEVPRAGVGILEHDRAAGPSESHIRFHLLLPATEGADLEAGVHEVERVRLKFAGEEIILDQAD